MTWRLAKSLEQLRSEINKAYPLRKKSSDGTIGDAKHASRNSDHNPWIKDGKVGVVSGIDFTHDPTNGVDVVKFAAAIKKSKDERVKYVIYNGKIFSGTGQKNKAWVDRPYTGANKHNKHVHLSVKSDKASYDDSRPWKLAGFTGVGVKAPEAKAPVKPKPSPAPPAAVAKPSEKAASGAPAPSTWTQTEVSSIQGMLYEVGFTEVGSRRADTGRFDGLIGPFTEAAVRAYKSERMGDPSPTANITKEMQARLYEDFTTGWKRQLAPGREDATVQKVVERVPEAATNAKTKWYSKWGTWLFGGVTTAGGAGNLLELTGSAKNITDNVRDYLPSASTLMLSAAFVVILFLLWRNSSKTEKEVTEAFQTGARR